MQAIKTPKEYIKNLFKELIYGIDKESVNKKINKKKPLIVDRATKKVLYGLHNLNQITKLGIMAVQTLEVSRQPLDANAIYFIEPTKESVQLVIQDFSVKHNYQYSCVNLVFNGQLSQQLMEEISKADHLVKRINTFQQFYLNLVFYSTNVCSLDIYNSLDLTLNNDLVEKMGKNLFILTGSFESFNYSYDIHYQANPLCEGIANVLLQHLKSKPKKGINSAQIFNILIVDRTYDAISPLVRSLSYGPFLRDIKKVQQNYIMTGEGKSRNIFYLDELDLLFTKHKNRYLSDASDQIIKQIKQYRQKSKTNKADFGEKQINLRDITQHNKTTNNHNFHINSLGQMIDAYKNTNILKVCDMQNMIISGLNKDGVQKSDKEIFVSCYEILSEMENKSDKTEDRMRLLLMMLMCIELYKQKDAVIKSLNDYKKQNIMKTLEQISPKITKLKQKRIKQHDYIYRHYPKLADLCMNIESKKGNNGFKTHKLYTNQKSVSNSKLINQKNKGVNSPKFIVFMAGPLGWNQISTIQKQSLKYDYYFIASRMCTPSQYLNQFFKSSQK